MDIPLISHICSILSRLSYMNNANFLHHYIDIFKISELVTQLHKIKYVDKLHIFEPKINNINVINKQINYITKRHYKDENYNSSNVKYISISTSNYSSVYIVADKRLNAIFVCFRGTYSPKSAISYIKASSIRPYKTCNSNKGILLGVFKIVGEIFYTIKESIDFLSNNFLHTTNYKLVTTGHSLGGGCSTIFSYLIARYNINKHIVCITFGSPRVMNKALISKFNKFIEDNNILFRRYVENGDPIALLPFTTNSGNNSYYHPDDDNETMTYLALSCETNKKTRAKIICNLYNKTKKKTPNVKYHGIYLGVSYKNAGEKIQDVNKEIKRNDSNTICRITTGGNNEKFKAVFFELDDLKREKIKNYFTRKLLKLKKIFTTDYKKQDIYMNKENLTKLLEESNELNEKNLNPLKFDKLVEIEHNVKNPNLYCL